MTRVTKWVPLQETAEETLRAAGYSEAEIKQHLRQTRMAGNAPRGRGRQTKWTPELRSKLVMTILRKMGGLMNASDRKVSAICRELADQPPWNSLARPVGAYREPWQVLRERYGRSMAAAIDIFENVTTGEVIPAIKVKTRRGRKNG
jgi:hypothetical protein